MRRIITALAAIATLVAQSPAHAQAPAPITTTGTLTATSAITPTLTPAQRQQTYAAIYSTAASVKIAQVVLEETAVARTNDVNSLKLLAGVVAINAQITTMLARRIPRTTAAQIQRDYDAQISKFRTDIQALLK